MLVMSRVIGRSVRGIGYSMYKGFEVRMFWYIEGIERRLVWLE